MKISLFGINWAAPENLIVVLPLFAAGILLLTWRFVKRRRAIRFLSNSQNRKTTLLYTSVTKQALKFLLSIIGFVFIPFAFLRPQWDKKQEVVAQEGRDVFIAFDISRSMLVEDVQPNRLEFAKKQVKNLLRILESERVGLILFSGLTIVQCPLTNDFAAFHMFLDQLDVETISSGTTAIDQAIKKALASFSLMPTRKSKLLVLLTDGEDFSSDLAGVRKEAAAQGLTVFALGVGSPEGGPIPFFDEKGNKAGHQKDQQGAIIISRLNEGILHNLAEQTGGKYMRLQHEDDLDVLVRHIKTFEKERFDDKKIEQFEEKYPYFLFVSFICFALEWLL